MTTKKIILAALTASAFQYLFEGFWYIQFFQGMSEANLGCILRKDPILALNFLTELALSLIIVLALSYQKEITILKGIKVGFIIGLLTGINQVGGWYVNFNITGVYFLTELIKIILLGTGSGLIASLFGQTPKEKV